MGMFEILGITILNNPDNLNNLNHPMLIGGLQKFSLLDFPGHISAIVFTQGCNFRCRFCYNPMLVCSDYAKVSPDKPAPLASAAGQSFTAEASASGGSELKYAWGRRKRSA